jgi:hypothetical protein
MDVMRVTITSAGRTVSLVVYSLHLAAQPNLVYQPFLDSTFEKAARFYEVDLPPGTVFQVHSMVQPRSSRSFAAGYQLKGYSAVEAPEGGRPESVIDVVAHELFHYLFFRMDPKRQAARHARRGPQPMTPSTQSGGNSWHPI